LVIRRNKIIIGVEGKLKKNLHLLAQLVQKDDVFFKIALLPFEKFTKLEEDWILISKRLKILPVMVRPIDKYNPTGNIYFHWNVKNLLYYRWHPRHLLKVPDFKYTTPAGVPSPRKVSEKNIAFVRLEQIALNNGGFITIKDCRSLGLERIPRFFYIYNPKLNRWELDKDRLASKLYPHIYKGILENAKK